MENIFLAAMVRLLLLLGTPLIIGLLTWFVAGFIALQQFTAVQAAEQARLVSEVRDLQDYRRDAYARGQAVLAQISNLQSALNQQTRTLERIDDRLNRQGAR